MEQALETAKEFGDTGKNITAANIITAARIILAPVLVYALFKKNTTHLPAMIFFICILTDAMDGFVARLLNCKTVSGKFLDPLADKLLLISTFFALTLMGKIPVWLLLLILGRDIIIVSGWAAIYIVTKVSKIEVRLTGKLSVITHMITISAVLLNLVFVPVLFYASGIITVVSVVDYCWRELRQA
jgi:cardiolipin synthase (CMP-forming)